MDDLLTIGAVLGLILLALTPLIGSFILLLLILKYLYQRYELMTQRYGFIVYQENGQMRDTGSEPLNQQMYMMLESGLMQKGFEIKLMFTDTDYDKVKNVIETTRKGYKEIEQNPIDNRVKVL